MLRGLSDGDLKLLSENSPLLNSLEIRGGFLFICLQNFFFF